MTNANAKMNYLEENRKRDMFFVTETNQCILIPQGWGDYFTIANGFCGGPDNKEDGPELFGHCPTGIEKYDTLWFSYSLLDKFKEVTEEAKTIDKNLFAYLDELNNEMNRSIRLM